jgi:hypothetical protein
LVAQHIGGWSVPRWLTRPASGTAHCATGSGNGVLDQEEECYRMSGIVIFIGYLLSIPSLLGMLFGV